MDLYVMVQFFPWFEFLFCLFMGMIMSFKQTEITFKPRKKLNNNNTVLCYWFYGGDAQIPSLIDSITIYSLIVVVGYTWNHMTEFQ